MCKKILAFFGDVCEHHHEFPSSTYKKPWKMVVEWRTKVLKNCILKQGMTFLGQIKLTTKKDLF